MPNFIKSALLPSDWIHDQVTEFCLIGRSNVGKSTLINALAKTKIAVTSKTPGRTHTVNFYDFDRFRLVDLPGYGYADYSNEKKDEMRYTIDTYLSKRINLYGVFHVIDAGVITKLDQEMSVYFKSKFVNHFIIVNKIDKLNQSEKSNLVKKVSSYTKVPNEKIIVISAKKSIGINQIWTTINSCLKSIKIN